MIEPAMKKIMEPLRSRSVVYWLLGALFTMNLGLVGVVYSNIQEKLNTKADKDIVIYMQQDIADIKSGIKDLINMHLNQGYVSPKHQSRNDTKGEKERS